MAVIQFPEQLLFHVGDQTQMDVAASNIEEALGEMFNVFPLLKHEMLAAGSDKLRSSVRIISDGHLIPDCPVSALKNVSLRSQTKIEIIVLSSGG